MVRLAQTQERTWKDEILESLDRIEISLLGTRASLGDMQIEGKAIYDILDCVLSQSKSSKIREEATETQRILNSNFVEALDSTRSMIRRRNNFRNQNQEEQEEAERIYQTLRKQINLSIGSFTSTLKGYFELHYYQEKIERIYRHAIRTINTIQSQTSLNYLNN